MAGLDPDLETVVEMAYAAVASPSVWSQVLMRLAKALECDGVCLRVEGRPDLGTAAPEEAEPVRLNIRLDADDAVSLCAWKAAGGPLSTKAAARAKVVLPHLARAARLLPPEVPLDTVAVLNTLETPCFLLGAGGRVLFENAAARDLAGLAAVHVHAGRLTAGDPTTNEALNDAITAACPEGRRQPRPGEVIIARAAGFPLVAIISPVLPQTATPGSVRAAVHVLDGDPVQAVGARLERLRRLFGLSEAEAEIAAALAQGRSVAEIAAHRRASEHTVRAQTKSLLEKVGAKRQVDLPKLQRLLAGDAEPRDSIP